MAADISKLDSMVVAKGTNIFCEGDFGACAYFIERGRVEVSVKRGGAAVRLAERGEGELFGEMAIIDNKPRTATVTALQDCELLLITQDQLTRRIDACDPILRICLQMILERFRSTMAQLNGVPFGDAPQPPAQMVGELEFGDRAAASAIKEIRLEREIEKAIESKDFELHFQPIVDLASGWIAGFESLARWRHKSRGLISPMVFIPTAEASGLIVPLSRFCLEQACRSLLRLESKRGPRDLVRDDMFVSVNISGRDFGDPDFVSNIMRTLDATGADPRRMKLEITETMLMQQPDRAARALEQCKFKGLSIAIDDFGAGYSSLGYLHKFPIDTLKIDRSFIMAMHDDPRSMKIIQSILGMADQLDIPVVAEGVETERDAIALKEMGCEYGQGYHFARPMPRSDAETLLADWRIGPAFSDLKQAV